MRGHAEPQRRGPVPAHARAARRVRRPRPRLPDDRPRARARRPRSRRHAADLAPLAAARRGRGNRLRARPRVPGVSLRASSRSTSTRPSSTPPRDTLPLVRELAPDVVVADILTLAPALAAELAGVPLRHAHPPRAPPRPARVPHLLARRASAAHRRRARALARGPAAVQRGLERGRVELNHTRARLGLAPLEHVHGGISRELALVATFPQLEYPRRMARGAEDARRRAADVGAARAGRRAARRWNLRREGRGSRVGPDAPLVLIAPSTAQDARAPLLRAALRGLADAPVRVLATYNRRLPPRALPRARQRARRRLGLLLAHHARIATSSSATPATARSCARSPAAAPSSPAPPWAT